MVRQNPGGGGGAGVLNRKIFEIEGGATAQFLILAVDIQAGSFQNCWFTNTIEPEAEFLSEIILFTEVFIAKRPFEHILWPEVFNFR